MQTCIEREVDIDWRRLLGINMPAAGRNRRLSYPPPLCGGKPGSTQWILHLEKRDKRTHRGDTRFISTRHPMIRTLTTVK
jgi:hypothetical protein